jgi:tRNA(Ile)-lysidine synthase
VQKKEVNEVLLNNRDGYTVYIDNTKIKNHLVLRNREQGDVFSPIGMTGSKKLKDYFIDEKIPKDKRDEMLLIADGAEIIWVIGKRISEKYKITPNTKNILMISIVDNKN